MRQFRSYKQADGSMRLVLVQKNPSGMSTAPDVEVDVVTMSAEEIDAVENIDASQPPESASDPAPVADPVNDPVVDPVSETVVEPVADPPSTTESQDGAEATADAEAAPKTRRHKK